VGSEGLRPVFTTWYNTPGMAWTDFNNTVTLGSLVGWAVLFLPVTAAAWWFTVQYRQTLGKRLEQTAVMRSIKASQVYNIYRWFSPE
jgi:uncharacterized protein (TIGR03546 family)